MKKSIHCRVLGILAVAAFSSQAWAGAMKVNFTAIRLEGDSPYVAPIEPDADAVPWMSDETFALSNKVTAKPKDDCKGEISVRKTPMTFDLNGGGEYTCPDGITFNLANSIEPSNAGNAQKVGTLLNGLLNDMNSFLDSAESCTDGGTFKYTSTDGVGASDEPSKRMYKQLAELAAMGPKSKKLKANIFEGGVLNSGNTLTVRGGAIFKTLGIQELSCAKVGEGEGASCTVRIPSTPNPKCKSANATKTVDHDEGKVKTTEPKVELKAGTDAASKKVPGTTDQYK